MALGKRFCVLVMICIFARPLYCSATEETWTEVRSPHFVVASNAGEKQARRIAKSFELFRSLLQTILNLKVDPGSPLIVLASSDQAGFDALLPRDRLGKGEAKPSGLFLGGADQSFVLLRTDVPRQQAYHAIYHEYVHMVMRLNMQHMPIWLSEGLAELFAFAELSDGASSIGRPSPGSLQVLNRYALIPLSTLMTVTHDSPHYHQQDKMQIFYAQSWAITHYLMLGDKRAHAGKLGELLSLLKAGVSDNEATERAFGDLTVLQKNLAQYIRSQRFYQFEDPAKLRTNEDAYSARTLPPPELWALRGRVLVQSNRLDEAKTMLEQALRLDTRSAAANEGMGLLLLRNSNYGEAQKYFSAAADLESKSFLTQFYAGQSAFLNNGDLKAAEGYLRKALAINPEFAPAYRTLSYVMLRIGGKSEEALELASKAALLEPGELSHRFNVVSILLEMKRYDDARTVCKNTLKLADTETERRQAESMLLVIDNSQQRMLESQRRAEALKEDARLREARRLENRKLEEQRQTQMDNRRQSADRPGPEIKTGPSIKLSGRIRSVVCGDPATMDVVIESKGTQRRLRTENYYNVQFWAANAPGKSGFEPCVELDGKSVEIEFLSVSGREFSGIIKTVIIEK